MRWIPLMCEKVCEFFFFFFLSLIHLNAACRTTVGLSYQVILKVNVLMFLLFMLFFSHFLLLFFFAPVLTPIFVLWWSLKKKFFFFFQKMRKANTKIGVEIYNISKFPTTNNSICVKQALWTGWPIIYSNI
jgi:hypothetical protein